MDQQITRPTRNSASDLTQDELRSYCWYSTETGLFTRIRDGRILGCVDPKGRVRISIGGFLYLAHRLAWLYHYGEWPPGLLDHESRIASDNRIDNLRLASKGQNAINSEATWSLSGLRGVYYQKNTSLWRVKIADVNIGYFKTKEAASAAYRAKAIELYGEFALVA